MEPRTARCASCMAAPSRLPSQFPVPPRLVFSLATKSALTQRYLNIELQDISVHVNICLIIQCLKKKKKDSERYCKFIGGGGGKGREFHSVWSRMHSNNQLITKNVVPCINGSVYDISHPFSLCCLWDQVHLEGTFWSVPVGEGVDLCLGFTEVQHTPLDLISLTQMASSSPHAHSASSGAVLEAVLPCPHPPVALHSHSWELEKF